MGWSGARENPSSASLVSVSVEPCGGERRKPVDLGYTLTWLARACFALASLGFVLTSSSVMRESFSAAFLHPQTLLIPPHQRLTYFALEPERPLTTAAGHGVPNEEEKRIRVERFPPATLAHTIPPNVHQEQPYIEDYISLPDNLDLLMVRQFTHFTLRDRLTACKYRDGRIPSKIVNADFVDGRLAVTCIRPQEYALRNITVTDLSIEVDDGDSPALTGRVEYESPARWDAPLVYAVLSTEEDVILLIKGVFEKRKFGDYGSSLRKAFRCVFGEGIETEVTAGAQEVFRCASPRLGPREEARRKVYLRYREHLIPSVAYYDRCKPAEYLLADEAEVMAAPAESARKHLVCACTMVWNVGKFLKEWTLYNSHLGVERFFLYDNNSVDEVEHMVGALREYNVTRHFWPWVKTQEAGFSHCAVRARRECVWLLLADVDEYLFPMHWLPLPSSAEGAPLPRSRPDLVQPFPRSALRDLIRDTQGRVALKAKLLGPQLQRQTLGQISIHCRNFGPSGWAEHPRLGVTQGYVCRDKKELRHKSMVLLEALTLSLANVIHHFDLRPEFTTLYVDPARAVVNHFKFQAWPEFVTKFARRASTYVVDWKQPVDLSSKDRPEGVGPEGIKPQNWERSHCFVNDTLLRDYVRSTFAVKEGENAGRMEWELV